MKILLPLISLVFLLACGSCQSTRQGPPNSPNCERTFQWASKWTHCTHPDHKPRYEHFNRDEGEDSLIVVCECW